MINIVYCLQKKPLLSDADFHLEFQQRYQPLFNGFAERTGASRLTLSFPNQEHNGCSFTPRPETALDALLEFSWTKARFEQLRSSPEHLEEMKRLFASLSGLVNLKNSQIKLLKPDTTHSVAV